MSACNLWGFLFSIVLNSFTTFFVAPEEEIVVSDVVILAEDAKQAMRIVKPSAMREVLVEVPNVSNHSIRAAKLLKTFNIVWDS